MNEIVSQFLLSGDRFMPEMHLIQPGFAYLHIERTQKFKETENS